MPVVAGFNFRTFWFRRSTGETRSRPSKIHPFGETPMTHGEFARQFRPVVRVQFDWPRMLDGKWPIESVSATTRSELETCVLPWYTGGSGKEVKYDATDAKPVTLSQF